MKFADYRHFKFYCLKIAQNKNVVLSDDEVKIINLFESFYTELLELETQGLILIIDNFLDKVCDMFKKGSITQCFSHMDYFIRKMDKVKRKEMEFYYILTSLKTMFDIEVSFQQKSIANDNTLYNNRVPIIKLMEAEEIIYTISNLDFSYTDRIGVYFLYDADNKLSYIGKSANCLLTRSLSSIRERGLLDFSKIELYETKTKSDVAIYEAYYISKFKPVCNKDIVYDDYPTISIPELQVSKVIARDQNQDFKKYKFQYIEKAIVNLDEISEKDRDNILIFNTNNFNSLVKKGYRTKYEAKEDIFSQEITKIRNSGGIATSDVYELIR